MNRRDAEAMIGSRVQAWTSANGVYVGELVAVIPSRPWRGRVRITGIVEPATLWESGRIGQRKGKRPGDTIEVGGVNIKPTESAGMTYAEAVGRQLGQYRAWLAEGRDKDLWWLRPAIEAGERLLASEPRD